MLTTVASTCRAPSHLAWTWWVLVSAAILSAHSASAQVASASATKEKKCTCPANSTADFYANPLVDRSSCLKKKEYAPTGVSQPEICSYPTLTQALAAATGGLVHFPSARAIAAGGTSGAPAVFSAEALPLTIVGGVTLTTSDDPALGGSGFHPDAYVILFNAGGADHALAVLSNGTLSGFTLQNGSASSGSMLTCSGPNVDVTSTILDGLNGTTQLDTGLLVSGSCDGTFSSIEARHFSGQGILVSSGSAASSLFSQLDLHHNHVGLRALQGSLVLLPAAIVGGRNRVHDNTGALDSTAMPTSSMGYGIVLGDAANQQGVVEASIQNTLIEANDVGVLVQETDTGTKSTHWTLFVSDIIANRAWGVWAYSSSLEPDAAGATNAGITFNGNAVGNNGWASADACQNDLVTSPPGGADENYAQLVFWGAYPASAELATLCATFTEEVVGADDAFGCNQTPQCVFNPDAPANRCRPSWDLSTTACGSTYSNTISGYHRVGPENEDQRVAIVAGEGAWVKAAYASFLTSVFAEHEDWAAVGVTSFASDEETICSPALVKCPAAQ
jgi:hypothetical protein